MRKARSKEKRPTLLAEVERRYRETPTVWLGVGSLSLIRKVILELSLTRLHDRSRTPTCGWRKDGKEGPGANGPYARTIIARELATPFMALRVSTIRDACSAIQDQA